MATFQTIGKIRLIAHKGVQAGVTRRLAAFCRRVQRSVRVEHRLTVRIAPSVVVSAPDGRLGWAVFAEVLVLPRKLRYPTPIVFRPEIGLGGDLKTFQERENLSRAEALDLICENLCHELGHYEQWRDGRRLSERGVEVRARNIFRQARKGDS
jgi:hypothetical protein